MIYIIYVCIHFLEKMRERGVRDGERDTKERGKRKKADGKKLDLFINFYTSIRFGLRIGSGQKNLIRHP